MARAWRAPSSGATAGSRRPGHKAPRARGPASRPSGARRRRRQPGHEARPADGGARRGHRPRAGSQPAEAWTAARRSTRSRSAAPGFINMRWRQGSGSPASTPSAPPATSWGRYIGLTPAMSTSSSCRPTRPGRCTSATHAAHSWATCSAGCSRPLGIGHARVLLQRSGTRSRARGLRARAPQADAVARGRLSRGLRRRAGGRAAGRSLGRAVDASAANEADARRRQDRRRWASEPARAGSRPSCRPRRRLRRLEDGELHPRRWMGRARRRALRQAGVVYEQDGATWFRSTDFGDDKDRVIYRTDGEPQRTSRPTSVMSTRSSAAASTS